MKAIVILLTDLDFKVLARFFRRSFTESVLRFFALLRETVEEFRMTTILYVILISESEESLWL